MAGRAPVASNVRITGQPIVGSTVTMEYTYSDADGDAEGGTEFVWCRVDMTCDGLSTTRTYVLQSADVGHKLGGHVQPKSATGSPNTGVHVNPPVWPASGTIQAPTPTVVTFVESPIVMTPFNALTRAPMTYTANAPISGSPSARLEMDIHAAANGTNTDAEVWMNLYAPNGTRVFRQRCRGPSESGGCRNVSTGLDLSMYPAGTWRVEMTAERLSIGQLGFSGSIKLVL